MGGRALVVSLASLLLALAAPGVAQGAAANVLECGAVGEAAVQPAAPDLSSIAACDVTVPQAGRALVVATSAVAATTAATARLALDVDATVGDTGTTRLVRAAPGRRRTVALQQVVELDAGTHRFHLLAGDGPATHVRPSLSVLFVPATGTSYQLCGAQGEGVTESTGPAFTTLRTCELEVPATSRAVLIGSASQGVTATGGAYDARYRLSTDGVTSATSDRFVGAYVDGGTGRDEAVSTLTSSVVNAGTRRFAFAVQQFSGTGPVAVRDAALAVLLLPAVPGPNDRLLACFAGTNDAVTSTGTDFLAVRSCRIDAPVAGRTLLLGSALAALDPDETRVGTSAAYRVGLFGVPSPVVERAVDVLADGAAGDGTDTALAVLETRDTPAGLQDAVLEGRRTGGTGVPHLFSAGLLGVFVPPPDLTAPVVAPTGVPASPTTAREAVLGFTVDDPRATVLCAVDDEPLAPCPAQRELAGLAVGVHVVRLQATDAAGNVSEVVTARWTVVAPATDPGPGDPAPAAPSTPGPSTGPGLGTLPPPTTPMPPAGTGTGTGTTPARPPAMAPARLSVAVRAAGRRRVAVRLGGLRRGERVTVRLRRGTRIVARRRVTARRAMQTLRLRVGSAGRYRAEVTAPGRRARSRAVRLR
jgi:hypothetical protein